LCACHLNEAGYKHGVPARLPAWDGEETSALAIKKNIHADIKVLVHIHFLVKDADNIKEFSRITEKDDMLPTGYFQYPSRAFDFCQPTRPEASCLVPHWTGLCQH